jgi:hypothetical protein
VHGIRPFAGLVTRPIAAKDDDHTGPSLNIASLDRPAPQPKPTPKPKPKPKPNVGSGSLVVHEQPRSGRSPSASDAEPEPEPPSKSSGRGPRLVSFTIPERRRHPLPPDPWIWRGHTGRPVFVPRARARTLEDIKFDSRTLKSIVTQLIQAMCSAHDDSDEFQRLQRRARMVRRHPAFVGLRVEHVELPEHAVDRVRVAYHKYLRFRNARDAADEIVAVMEKNRRIAPIILSAIEKVAKDDREFMQEQMFRARLGRRPADGSLAVHYMDLEWMTSIPDYRSVALLYRQGHDRPTDLEALVANVRRREPDRGRETSRRQQRAPRSEGESWGTFIGQFDLADLVMVTSFIPQSLVDQVIRDHRRTSDSQPKTDVD